jgi:signal transduction histidine kinase
MPDGSANTVVVRDPGETSDRAAGSTWRGWLGYAVGWLALSALYALAVALSMNAPPSVAAPWGLLAMGTAAVLGVGVWRLTGVVPWGDVRSVRFWAIHVAAAAAYATVYTAALCLPWGLTKGWDSALDGLRSSPVRGWMFLTGVWLYDLVAGGSYAVRLSRELRRRQVAAARAEAAAARAQIHALRTQLNPHFLFNALHSLGALIRHDGAAAERAVERLGDLLRYTLDAGADGDVSLRREWEFTRNYLDLERIRFGDRLGVALEVEDAALDERVPAFVLQPLVENAVRHGVARRGEGGAVRVAVARAGGSLVLSVEDDGPGARPAALSSSPGLGLRSLRRRLEALYGDGARLRIETTPGRGFRATVELPAGAHPGSETPRDGRPADGRPAGAPPADGRPAAGRRVGEPAAAANPDWRRAGNASRR